MPSVTKESPSPPVPLAKKRRRDDNESITTTTTTSNDSLNPRFQFPLSPPSLQGHPPRSLFDGSDTPHYHQGPALRKVMPLPSSKRIRTIDVKEDELRLQTLSTSPQTKSNISPISQDHERPTFTPTATTTTKLDPATLMTRCHICSRKPTKKTDLDSFADCEGCRQRTCFICIRECLDWRPRSFRDEMTGCDRHKARVSLGAMSTDSFTMQDADETAEESGTSGHGQNPEGVQTSAATKDQQSNDSKGWPAKGEHRQMVCSKCCIENGNDGDVVCLGCLPFVG
ncbi:hypothetical protein V8F20_000672 [Naviculisporaceae sp. PSN 640]